MNPKTISSKEENQEALCKLSTRESKPPLLKLRNLTNQPEEGELRLLKLRIDDLQVKISQLQAKIKAKRKRIRRKSSEVQKRHKCQFCRKMYGSLVSLNLHLRIKHKREKEALVRQDHSNNSHSVEQSQQPS